MERSESNPPREASDFGVAGVGKEKDRLEEKDRLKIDAFGNIQTLPDDAADS